MKWVRWAPLVVGIVLFAAAVGRIDFRALQELSSSLAIALPLAIVINGLTQVVRTLTWRCCLPPGVSVPFRRLLRVRLAAEAFSYVTFSGVAGEPVKVVLLKDDAPTPAITASVILERLTFSVATLALVGLWAAMALLTMPLPTYWRGVFIWFVLVAAVVVCLAAAAVGGDGTHMSRFLEWLARATRGWLGTHAPGRFLVQAEREMLAFARTDRRRLLRVFALDAVNYVLMAAEVWAIVRVAGPTSSYAAALTIETFTRVVSIASAAIPGGLGALEASHLAAATALGVAQAGVALAIVRRLRGLFWAGIGFAIYPRRMPQDDRRGVTLLYLADDPSTGVSPLTRIAAMSLAERVLRSARREGCDRVIVWAPQSGTQIRALAARLGGVAPAVVVAENDGDWLAAIAAADGACRVIGSGVISRPSIHVRNAEDVAAAEMAIRRSIFKPTDGVLARFNRRLSLPLSLRLVRTPITANQISVVIAGLGLWAAWLFSRGTYAASLAGATISLMASILDGCDGEVARLKYQESALGCWLETIGDYTYYFAIFIGITIGAVRSTHRPAFYNVGMAALGGSLITAMLLILLRQRMTAARPERFGAEGKAHFSSAGTWARFLAWLSVCATRAVMPYGILMLAVLGLTPAVIVFAALGANIYWLALTTRLRTLLTVPVRVALVIAMALTAGACGGEGGTPVSPSVTPPSAPFSTTDLREGTGTTATAGRIVSVAYTGWLYDPVRAESKGAQFDTSTNFSFQLGVGRVIAGWDRGVEGMKVGGQRRLVIPPNLGYGSQMINAIPPNSTLVFDVTLLGVN